MKSKDIAIVGILLAIGAILRYFLAMLHTPLTPNMIIAFYCLAIILIRPKVFEALGIGIVSGLLSMLISSSMFPPANLISEPIGALVCFGLYAILNNRTKLAPTITTFLSTLASGFSFAAIAIIFVGATILTKYNGNLLNFVIVFVPIVVITAVFNAIIVQILYVPSSRVLIREGSTSESPKRIEKEEINIPQSNSPPTELAAIKIQSQKQEEPITPKQIPQDLADRYTELEFIGKGGFARVFKGKRKDGKFVAIKIPISMDAVTGKSFIAEMQNWTKLSHPNIVRLYEFNIMPVPYFEEELCDAALSNQNKPIESEDAAWILFNICEGIKFAHAKKIIHRDLKPQNILLKNGVPKISDWGLSRIITDATTTTTTSFTPYYAAPEQINNRVKDERTDIWQLGVILYELVTGELPFQGESMIEIGMNITTKDPKRPGEVKPDAKVMDAIVMKCLQKDPKNRYPSVIELQKDLATYLRKNYAELLKTSVSVQDYNQSAYYCGDLVMINMLTGDVATAYKYLLDFVHYSKGNVKTEAEELSEQLKMRMEMGVTEIPDELVQKADLIVHQVGVGFRKRG